VLSRLIIALKTIATECVERSQRATGIEGEFLAELSDLLWSVGEKAGALDSSLDMLDEKRR